jgi:hypothetical protein
VYEVAEMLPVTRVTVMRDSQALIVSCHAVHAFNLSTGSAPVSRVGGLGGWLHQHIIALWTCPSAAPAGTLLLLRLHLRAAADVHFDVEGHWRGDQVTTAPSLACFRPLSGCCRVCPVRGSTSSSIGHSWLC